jgi:hypothetical protein
MNVYAKVRAGGMGSLGSTYKVDPSSGAVIDCDDWSNLFQGVCWNPFAATVVPSQSGSEAVGSPAAGATPPTSFTTDTSLSLTQMVEYGGLAVIGIAVLYVFLNAKRR